MRTDRTFLLVLFCFVLSGFAGLLFQTVWTRQFGLVFGTSELAVATVLAGYMGGLAAGAALARRWVLRARRPLLVYGLLELGIGASALAVPSLISASTTLAVALFGGNPSPPEASGLALSIFYLACSFAILLVPTSLMGATLPVLARFAVRSDAQVGPRIGWLYAMNTVGAVLGTLTTAFWLLPRLSLGATVWIGVALNGIVFVLAMLLARGGEERFPNSRTSEFGDAEGRYTSWTNDDWILPIILLSGVGSFTYEVLWTRLLSHIFGGTVYAFGTMLASFLAGIAIGSAIASRWASDRDTALRAFAISQVGIACAIVAAFLGADRLPDLALAVGAGGHAGALPNAFVGAVALLPGALFIGATFPLAVRILARGDGDASTASARVYAWNTIGAIIGSIGAGFVWIPLLGYHGTVAAAAALNLLLAAGAAWMLAAKRRWLALPIALAALVLVVQPPPPWRLLSTSALDLINGHLTTLPVERIRRFEVGRSTAVMLSENRLGGWDLSTNGLQEAMIRRKGVYRHASPPDWLGGLPLLARPASRSLLLVGLGGGTTLEAIPAAVERIDVIELEPEVIAANRSLAALRDRDPLADPRIHVTANDARGALQLTTRKWDMIASQPSHPWTAGASHLFTREFFELASEHLEQDGVFVQWMELQFVDEQLLRSLVATLGDVFEHTRLYWFRASATLFFVASDAPLDLEHSVGAALRQTPDAFHYLGVRSPEDVALHLELDEAAARRFARGAPISTDDRNLFQFLAPHALRAPLTPDRASPLLAEARAGSPMSFPSDWNWLRYARGLTQQFRSDEAERLAASSEDEARALAMRGFAKLRGGTRDEARALLSAALALDPGAPEVLFALSRSRGDGIVPRYAIPAGAQPSAQLSAVAEGSVLARAEKWHALAALDARLAATPLADPVYADALRLRIFWRIHTRDRARGREALEFAERLKGLLPNPFVMVLRARAAQAAGESEVALRSLRDVLLGGGLSHARMAQLTAHVETGLREIGASPGPLAEAEWREVAALLAEVRAELRGAERPR